MSALWLLLLVFFPRVAGSSPLIPYYAPLAIFFLSSVTVKKKKTSKGVVVLCRLETLSSRLSNHHVCTEQRGDNPLIHRESDPAGPHNRRIGGRGPVQQDCG